MLAFQMQWRIQMTKHKVLSAALIATAVLATPAMARTSHVASSRPLTTDANAFPPPVMLTAVSAFQRRASAHSLQLPGATTMSLANLSRITSGEHQG